MRPLIYGNRGWEPWREENGRFFSPVPFPFFTFLFFFFLFTFPWDATLFPAFLAGVLGRFISKSNACSHGSSARPRQIPSVEAS